MTQTVSGFTVPAGSDPVSSIDDTLVTFAGEVRAAITAATEIPSQTGNAGKYLKTDGSASSWQTVDAVPQTLIDAKGDLVVGTADNTAARLPVGTDGYVLQADSAQTSGVKWAASSAGSLTLLSTTTLNSGSTTQTISGIATTYKNLFIVVKNVKMGSTGASWFMRVNADTESNYLSGYNGAYWADKTNAVALSTSIYLGSRNSNSASWNKQGYGVFTLTNYNAAGQVPIDYKVINHDGGAGTDTLWFTQGLTVYNAAAAITSITLAADTNFTSGTVLIYGVN